MKKNFVKKLITGALAITLGVTALAGCGSSSGTSDALGQADSSQGGGFKDTWVLSQ